MADKDILLADKVSFAVGELQILSGVSLAVEGSGCHLIIGPNGAGKTTFFNIVSGQYRPTGGAVFFDGRDITKWRVGRRAKAGISRTFQIASLFPELSVDENLDLAAMSPSAGRIRLDNPLRTFGSDDALNFSELKSKRSQRVSQLAYGEQRRLEIALSLLTKPVVLLLDEPMAGLTRTERLRIAGLLSTLRNEIPLLMIEHHLEDVLHVSDRVSFMHLGEILLSGDPNEIARSELVRKIYLGKV